MAYRLSIFINEARQIVGTLPLPDSCREKIATVEIDSLEKNPRLQYFGREYQKLIKQTIAFYDPNKNVIFVNKKKIAALHDNQIREILTHEFIHAASNHCSQKNKQGVVLYSGLKKQLFSKLGDLTQCQSLNEGYVQNICNNLLGYISQAYFEETLFVKNLISIIGEDALAEAFLLGHVEKLNAEIDRYFSADNFTKANQKLDAGDYKQAMVLINSAKTAPATNPDYVFAVE